MRTNPAIAPAALALLAALGVGCDPGVPEETLVSVETLPACEDQFLTDSAFVKNEQFGVDARNLLHHEIFRFDSKKAPWRPITGFRATVCGNADKYYVATEHDDQKEYDWNIDVTPNAALAASMGEDSIECEVTPAQQFRDNAFFPGKGNEDKSPRTNQPICIYGPWVRDLGNDDQREIHPAEALWWKENGGSVQLLFVQDAATHRFTENADYDFDEDHDGQSDSEPRWAPWVLYPNQEQVRIPFQYDSRTRKYSVITVHQTQGDKVVTDQEPTLRDASGASVHRLVPKPRLVATPLDRTTLVEVQEAATAVPNLGVRFIDMCKDRDGVVHGNVSVVTAIGHRDTRDAGFQALLFGFGEKVNTEPEATTR